MEDRRHDSAGLVSGHDRQTFGSCTFPHGSANGVAVDGINILVPLWLSVWREPTVPWVNSLKGGAALTKQ